MLSHSLLPMLIPSEAMPQTNKKTFGTTDFADCTDYGLLNSIDFFRFLSVESVQSVVSVILFKT